MRIKTYSAPSIAQAMQDIRQEFGEDALVLSTQHVTGGGVRVTIAIENTSLDDEIQSVLSGAPQTTCQQAIQKALFFHRVPEDLSNRMMASIQADTLTNPEALLARALDKTFSFLPLPTETSKRAFFFVGPAGSGKTIVAAKMAVRAKLSNQSVCLVTTDTKRAGAMDQLSAFAKILEVPLIQTRSAEQLSQAIDSVRARGNLVVVDTAGVNPFLSQDIHYLQELKGSIAGIEPVLVLPAGMDALESADIAQIFLSLGCKRLVPTHLDMSRRLGNILYAAQKTAMSLADGGMSPYVSEGFCALDPVILAQFILHKQEGKKA